MEKIAVVILNWNGVKLLEQFLPSVIQYSPEATVYVADNASTDESIAFVKKNYPTIKIVQNKMNQGFAGGYNDALQHIDAEIYALVNSDIEVTENWLKPILVTFKTEPETAIIQPKILDFKKKDYFEYAGAGGGFIDQFGYPFCRGRIFDTLEKDNGQYNDSTEIFWASGACFFIRSSVYKEQKGFDEDFFAHQEEIDLCWRTINRGFKIKYCSESIVYHVGGATLQQANPKKTYLNFRNSLLMLTKNLPQNTLFQVLIIRMLLDGIAGMKFIIEGQFSHCWAIIRAHFSFYGLFLKNYKKREKKQVEIYFKTKSIVYGYYVKNGTVFADII
ncbi:glycosyltransferase family 2 protein [Flavobacterium sp. M31R6]|uniref:glycosyltransferase family 2 protein n=1 Tax=Flavobacterium sp. M31R6 TaxID=2739062 RepID=UPI00156A2E37|nr:glycosyltransferase family 2 protein [Flavobacterium sp. M31R6]QKJ63777.1 glycosyltransferase family 2 protein [Flavobacterium sp. M31R6]